MQTALTAVNLKTSQSSPLAAPSCASQTIPIATPPCCAQDYGNYQQALVSGPNGDKHVLYGTLLSYPLDCQCTKSSRIKHTLVSHALCLKTAKSRPTQVNEFLVPALTQNFAASMQ